MNAVGEQRERAGELVGNVLLSVTLFPLTANTTQLTWEWLEISFVIHVSSESFHIHFAHL